MLLVVLIRPTPGLAPAYVPNPLRKQVPNLP
jgi:hypothetical protein